MNGLTRNEIAKAQNHIDSIAQDFAERVQPIFQAMNWTWSVCNNDLAIPTAHSIELTIKCLAEYLTDGIGKMHATCSTGRIQIVVLKDDNNVRVRLELTPEWSEDSFTHR